MGEIEKMAALATSTRAGRFWTSARAPSAPTQKAEQLLRGGYLRQDQNEPRSRKDR